MQTFLLDVAVVAAFILTVAIFTYRGLAKSAMGFLVLFASFLVCKMFGGPFGEWIDSTFVFEPISNSIKAILDKTIGSATDAVDGAGLFEALPGAIKSILDFAGADVAAIEDYLVNFDGNVNDSLTEIARTIAAPVSSAIASVLAYVILFIASTIVFKLIASLLLKIFELPVLNVINRVGGFVLGLVAGFIFCWVGAKLFSVIVALLALKFPQLAEFSNVGDTVIYSFFVKF